MTCPPRVVKEVKHKQAWAAQRAEIERLWRDQPDELRHMLRLHDLDREFDPDDDDPAARFVARCVIAIDHCAARLVKNKDIEGLRANGYIELADVLAGEGLTDGL